MTHRSLSSDPVAAFLEGVDGAFDVLVDDTVERLWHFHAALRGNRVDAFQEALKVVSACAAYVERDPRARSIDSCDLGVERWESLSFGAFVVDSLALQTDRPRPFRRQPQLAGLSLAERAVVLAIDIELLSPHDAASLFGVTTGVVAEVYARSSARAGLPRMLESHCPGWPMVHAYYRLGGSEEAAARTHLNHCGECSGAHGIVRERRELISRTADPAGWGWVGRAWVDRHRWA